MSDSNYETVTHPGIAHSDERGEIINILQAPLEHVAIIERKAGSVFANHYHPGNNVQRMYLIRGRYRSVSAPVDRAGRFLAAPREIVVVPGDLTEVGPMVGHAYEALETCFFLNLNSAGRDAGGYGEHTIPLPVKLIP